MVNSVARKINDKAMARRIAEEVANRGGRTFYVGGYVRDKVIGKSNKDVDIEIHGITQEELVDILKGLGTIDSRKVGDNFGILALKSYDVDIAMPRSERPLGGGGHKDFVIDVDPFIGYDKASARRDFTMNALMEDVLTGEILDYHGGIEDMEHKVIHHVDDDTYIDDPLRVLRAAQFASRFGFTIAPDTIAISKNMDLSKLSRERIAGELNKALLKSDKPSIFFDELRKMDQLDYWFPEVAALIDVPQDPEHHPEGDVYTHTMLVLDEAAKYRDKVLNPSYFMVAVLCHDFGKPNVTVFNDDKGKLQALHHDMEGVELAHAFVKRIYNDNRMMNYVDNMVEMHMKPSALLRNLSKSKAYFAMFDKSVSPEELILLSRCDSDGRTLGKDFGPSEQILRDKLAQYDELMTQPHVTGDDLIKLGYKAGPEFKKILDYAHKCHLSGVSKDVTVRQIMGEYHSYDKTVDREIVLLNDTKVDEQVMGIV